MGFRQPVFSPRKYTIYDSVLIREITCQRKPELSDILRNVNFNVLNKCPSEEARRYCP